MTVSAKNTPMQIKKYGNRRLYSSSETRFVTIDEVADAVRSGQKVVVTDGDTQQDITAEILTQILLENRRAQHFPIEMLEQMIRLNEEAVKGFMGAYLDQSLRMIQNFQETVRNFNPFLSILGKPGSRAEGREPAKRKSRGAAPAARSAKRGSGKKAK